MDFFTYKHQYLGSYFVALCRASPYLQVHRLRVRPAPDHPRVSLATTASSALLKLLDVPLFYPTFSCRLKAHSCIFSVYVMCSYCPARCHTHRAFAMPLVGRKPLARFTRAGTALCDARSGPSCTLGEGLVPTHLVSACGDGKCANLRRSTAPMISNLPSVTFRLPSPWPSVQRQSSSQCLSRLWSTTIATVPRQSRRFSAYGPPIGIPPGSCDRPRPAWQHTIQFPVGGPAAPSNPAFVPSAARSRPPSVGVICVNTRLHLAFPASCRAPEVPGPSAVGPPSLIVLACARMPPRLSNLPGGRRPDPTPPSRAPHSPGSTHRHTQPGPLIGPGRRSAHSRPRA